MKELAKKMIAWYQREVSPKTPPSCRFYPTCSTYTYQAVDRYGCIIGCILGFFRIMRCCPLFKGGYDPVPENLLGRKKKTTSEEILDDTENSDNQ